MPDHGLGRIYAPDARDYGPLQLHGLLGNLHAAALPPSASWADAAVLDQGAFGTCVGNGWAGWGDSEPVKDAYTETDARAIYFEATILDGTPDNPDAPGGGQQGSSVRSGAKAMQARGKLTAYAFTQSVAAVKEWLANHGPVVIGADWTNDMFTPDAKGFVHPTGGVAGGHCWLIRGYDDHPTLGTTFLNRQSWGPWGDHGDFYLTEADLATLLTGIDSPGEACLSAEVSAPAPGPFPSDPDATLAAAVRVWALARHSGSNRRAALAFKAWLTAKGL